MPVAWRLGGGAVAGVVGGAGGACRNPAARAFDLSDTTPSTAEAPPGHDFFGLHVPPIPKLKLPDGMSLPEMLSSVGSLPEKVGLPSANHVIEVQFDKLIQKLNVAIPAVESLGYEVRNFEVDWTLPPQIKVRLQSSETVSDQEYEHVLASVRGDLIVESIILSLGGVRKIQRASGLAPFKRAQLEVDMGIPPKVVMIFSDPTNKFHERFVASHEALQKAIEEGKGKAQAPAKPVAVSAPAQ